MQCGLQISTWSLADFTTFILQTLQPVTRCQPMPIVRYRQWMKLTVKTLDLKLTPWYVLCAHVATHQAPDYRHSARA